MTYKKTVNINSYKYKSKLDFIDNQNIDELGKTSNKFNKINILFLIYILITCLLKIGFNI